MLSAQQMNRPATFESILSSSMKSSNKLSSSKRRAANARQQSIGGSDPVEGSLLRADGDIKLPNNGEQVAPSEPKPLTGSNESASNDHEPVDQEKGAELAGQRRGRRHLASAPKHSDLGEEQMAVSSSATGSETDQAGELDEADARDFGSAVATSDANGSIKKPFKAELVWRNIILFIILHSSLPIGLYMLYTQQPWLTLAFAILGMYASGLGVTGGTHRLWSHKSYKASWPVQFLLMLLQTLAGQNSIYTWSRDHRVHHKFSETDADPHNIKRGFFFAHMGWLCCKKHPDVKEKGKLIDMSDLKANSLVMFQHRHFWWLSLLVTVLIPTMIPVVFWGERFWTSFVFSFMIRYLVTLHVTWLVNSAAHYYGTRPYDSKIEARESPYVILNGLGEGFHNYHHTFPYDYSTSEFGRYYNITTAFIDLCAALGLAKDRRKADKETVMKRRMRTGDLVDKGEELHEQELDQAYKSSNGVKVNGSSRLTNGVRKITSQMACSGTVLQKSIDEREESTLVPSERSINPLAPLSNIIHELPYISGLTSMKYTM